MTGRTPEESGTLCDLQSPVSCLKIVLPTSLLLLTLQLLWPTLTACPVCFKKKNVLIPGAESNPFLPNELDEKETGKLNFLLCSRSVLTVTPHLTYFGPKYNIFCGDKGVTSSEMSAQTSRRRGAAVQCQASASILLHWSALPGALILKKQGKRILRNHLV